ncbi:MAG: HAMP domain-containing protein, partial [Planctomycetes bacterium]|nr:HAMP domain-containing protein [Planctomycetota bacterium]
KRVLSAYGPIELDSLRWAVLAEKDIDEAYAPIREFGRKVLIVASGMALLVSLLAIVCSSLLTRPLRLLTEGAKRLGAGDTGVRVNIKSQDDFGELGRVFNEMADSIKSQTSKLEDQVRENQELLLSILPASAVEQRKEGDERASRQFSDVSVLFAELLGLEEFSGSVGESKALSVLGDLIAAFDEAAQKHGIEKVKTIGGAYLAVCGLSVNRPDYVRRIIQFAQEISRIVSMFNREYRAEFNILVGINSGPVVGGVVCRRKFLYDLWGDTVTIAKKLAAGSVDSQIRVTSNVRERIGDQVVFEGPFRIEVSGKPPIDAWRVNA